MKRLIAALSFFTRLPFWRLATLEKQHYERVVPLWPYVGLLTGGVMALVFYVTSHLLQWDYSICLILALLSRILITGALHEDGFADFCDGFGGGGSTGSKERDRQRTLEIMKDSHIGTYGVLGLIIYFLLLYSVLRTKPLVIHPLLFVAVDVLAKYFSSTIIYFLPYARKEEEAKNRLVYQHTTVSEKIVSFVIAAVSWGYMAHVSIHAAIIATLAAIITVTLLFRLMHNRIQGYTGDCCGATFIITELVIWLLIIT